MPAGRPPKYDSPEEMQRIIDLYFIACKAHRLDQDDDGGAYLAGLDLTDDDLSIIKDIEDWKPTISGLAYTLNMTTEALRNYEGKDEFLATVKRAKQRVELFLEQHLYGTAVTGSIFNLKNNFGWKDKTEQEIKATHLLTDLSEEELDRKVKQLESQYEQSSKD